jgi:hypothetical protein
MKKSIVVAILAVIFLWIGAASAATAVPVSPGGEGEWAVTGQTCPTFSWSPMNGATTYTIEVFEQQTSGVMPYNQMRSIAAPVLSLDIGAPALSWTPSSGECLTRGIKYSWYVRGVDQDGNGDWSEPIGFEVEAATLSIEQKEAVQEVVKEYLKGEGARISSAATVNGGIRGSVSGISNHRSETDTDIKDSEVRRAAVDGGSGPVSVVMPGNVAINNYDIRLKADERYNGLGWYGSGKTFAGSAVNGPVLYGYDGGALGVTDPNIIVISWRYTGYVGIGTTTPSERLDVIGNVKAQGFAYTAPQTRYWSINGSSFQPDDETHTYNKSNGKLSPSTTGGIFSAPVHLPNGAVVKKMVVKYKDNNFTDSFYLDFLRNNMMGGGGQQLASFESTDTGTGFASAQITASIVNSTIDNSTYAYKLFFYSADGTTNHELGGVLIEYTVTSPLP